MNVLAKTITKIASRRRNRAKEKQRKVSRIRKAITAKSGQWEGTSIIRHTRDAG